MALFVLMSLGIIIFLYYQNQQLKGIIAKYKTPATSPTPTATADPTANWLNYTNNFGYSFKYPQGFTAEEPAQFGSPAASPKSVSLFVYDSISKDPYTERYIDIAVNPTKSDIVPQIQATVGGLSATKAVLSTVNFDLYTVKLSNGKYLEVYVSTDPARIDVANKILSTFKFTSATPSAVSSATPISTSSALPVTY